jgi:hypothetical protein
VARRARGWDVTRADKKADFSTHSVGTRTTGLATLQRALSKHAGIAGLKARQQDINVLDSLLLFNSNPDSPIPAPLSHPAHRVVFFSATKQ